MPSNCATMPISSAAALAPVIAPIIGGFIFTHFDWHGVFWALALIGVMLWVANWRLLPETLKPELKQPLQFKALFQGYREVVGDRRFLLLAIASLFLGLCMLALAFHEIEDLNYRCREPSHLPRLQINPTGFVMILSSAFLSMVSGVCFCGIASELPF